MAIQLPDVEFKAAKAQSVTSVSQDSVLMQHNPAMDSARTLAAATALADQFHLRNEGIKATEAFYKARKNMDEEYTRFVTTVHNPSVADIEQLQKNVNDFNNKVFAEHVEASDWRIRTKFNQDLGKEMHRFDSSVAQSAISMQHKATLENMSAQIALEVDELSKAFGGANEGAALDTLMASVDAMADIRDLDRESAEYKHLVKSTKSMALLNAGITALEQGRDSLMFNRVPGMREHMEDEDWRKLLTAVNTRRLELSRAKADKVVSKDEWIKADIERKKKAGLFVWGKGTAFATEEDAYNHHYTASAFAYDDMLRKQNQQASIFTTTLDAARHAWAIAKDDPRLKGIIDPRTRGALTMEIAAEKGGNPMTAGNGMALMDDYARMMKPREYEELMNIFSDAPSLPTPGRRDEVQAWADQNPNKFTGMSQPAIAQNLIVDHKLTWPEADELSKGIYKKTNERFYKRTTSELRKVINNNFTERDIKEVFDTYYDLYENTMTQRSKGGKARFRLNEDRKKIYEDFKNFIVEQQFNNLSKLDSTNGVPSFELVTKTFDQLTIDLATDKNKRTQILNQSAAEFIKTSGYFR